MYRDCFYDIIFHRAEGPAAVGLSDSFGVKDDMNRTCRTHVGSGSSWMWSIRTSCLMQKRHRCCRDLTLLNLETGYRSWTGVGGRPEPDTSQKTLYLYSRQRKRQTGGGRQWEVLVLVTGDSGSQEVEELSVLGVHDGSLYELNHRVTTILKLRMTPETERPCRGQTEQNESEWETTTPRVHFTVRQPITEFAEAEDYTTSVNSLWTNYFPWQQQQGLMGNVVLRDRRIKCVSDHLWPDVTSCSICK